MTRRSLIFCCYLLVAQISLANDHVHQGGERLGQVHFASSCTPAAQQQLDRGVALLHSFEFGPAISSFNAALDKDSTCGIAYWGISLSQWSNPFAAGQKDSKQLQKGRDAAALGTKAGAKTERERDYIAAVGALYEDFEHTSQRARLAAYRDRMEAVASKYQADHEATIFYALAIAAAEDPADKTYAGRLKAGSMLEKLFEEEPNHPGLAHYIIHTYDVPALAQQALSAARRYAEIAPDAPHALHMPSHTFTRLGYWQDSIRSNLQAAASARRAGEVAEELHASDYEVYAYLQTGQDEEARHIVSSLPEIASRFDPEKTIGGAGGPSVGYFALAAIPGRFALERGAWEQATHLSVRKTPFPYTEAVTFFARGLGFARMGKGKPAYDEAKQLRAIREQLSKARESYWALQVEIEEAEVRAWAILAESNTNRALQTMQSAASLEDGTEKSAITPGPLAPAHELLGEMLLELHQPLQALQQFESTLEKEPGRLRSLYGAGRAAELSGRTDLAQRYFGKLLRTCELSDKPGRKELLEAEAALKH
jgi:hypothetical protein